MLVPRARRPRPPDAHLLAPPLDEHDHLLLVRGGHENLRRLDERVHLRDAYLVLAAQHEARRWQQRTRRAPRHRLEVSVGHWRARVLGTAAKGHVGTHSGGANVHVPRRALIGRPIGRLGVDGKGHFGQRQLGRPVRRVDDGARLRVPGDQIEALALDQTERQRRLDHRLGQAGRGDGEGNVIGAEAQVADAHCAVLVEAEHLGQVRHLQHVLLVHVERRALGQRADHGRATRDGVTLVHQPERRHRARRHGTVRVDRARDEVDADVAAAPLVRDEEARARHAFSHERAQARLRAALGQPVHDLLHAADAVQAQVVGQPARRRLGRACLAVDLKAELRVAVHDVGDALDRHPVGRALGGVEVVDGPRLLRRRQLLARTVEVHVVIRHEGPHLRQRVA